MRPLPLTSPSSGPRRARAAVILLTGSAWVLTMAQLWDRQAGAGRDPDDVRALVEASRLSRRHASAVYSIRLGEVDVGRLESTVSGGQEEEQLAYVVRGRLDEAHAVELRGFVLSDWERRPERFVLELLVGDERHRVDGGLDEGPGAGVIFRVRTLLAGDEQRFEWVLADPPVLIPGPLPLPELPTWRAAGPSAREGTLVDPVTGAPTSWSVQSAPGGVVVVAGLARETVRHVLVYGVHQATVWTEPTGFPLRAELPLGLVVELVEENR